MAKPRTNYDAVQYWADSILTNERAPELIVNSIIVRNDTVYSFGTHYPMGKIFRWLDTGKVRRVVITSDFYPSRGFASTPTDQGNVESCAREAVRELRNVELEFAPLSGYQFKSGIPCLPKASDPALERPYIEVPRYFFAADPGPEPVKTNEGCIAGQVEEYSYQTDAHIFDPSDARPSDFLYIHRIGANYSSLKARRAANGVIVWVDETFNHWHRADLHREHPNAHVEVCKHCSSFADHHRTWSARYHGGYAAGERVKGFKLYTRMMETYGSEAGWREAYREEWRRVRNGRKYIEGWIERNFIPLSAVSTDADGIPILDSDGHAMRKDSEAYFRKLRERQRVQRRLQREAEDSARLRLRARRVLERRQRRRAETFFGRADRVANELRAMRLELAANTTDGRES